MKRSVTDFKTNWKATLTGVILAVATILTAVGVFTPEQSTEVQAQGVNILNAVGLIIEAVSSLLLVFKFTDK